MTTRPTNTLGRIPVIRAPIDLPKETALAKLKKVARNSHELMTALSSTHENSAQDLLTHQHFTKTFSSIPELTSDNDKLDILQSLKLWATVKRQKHPSLFSAKSPTKSCDTFKEKMDVLKQDPNRREINELKNEKCRTFALSYDSKHGNSRINLNGKVKNKSGGKIWCRHLAFWFLRNNSKSINSLSNLRTQKPQSLDDDFYDKEKLLLRADHVSTFELKYLGVTLAAECKNMNLGDEKLFILGSENHLMAITIYHKQEGAVILKFYDPNKTLVYKRIILKNIQDLGELKITHLLNMNQLMDYKVFNVLQLRRYDDLDTLAEKNKSATYPEIKMITEQNMDLVKKLLYLALEHGHTTTVVALLTTILESNFIAEQKLVLLMAKRYDKKTGLLLALSREHTETVSIFIATILKSNLTDKQKLVLLMAKDTNVISVISNLFLVNNTEMIRVYTEAILNSNIEIEQKIELLVGNCLPGLCIAVITRSTETTKVFINNIFNSNLTDEQKLKLLLAKNDSGDSPLLLLLLKDSIINNDFVNDISNPNIPNQDKLNRLKTILKCMLENHQMTNEILESFRAKDNDGSTTLFKIFERNNEKEISDNLDIISQLSLSETETLELLLAQDSQDVPWIILQLKNADKVKKYMQFISHSPLSTKIKVRLFKHIALIAKKSGIKESILHWSKQSAIDFIAQQLDDKNTSAIMSYIQSSTPQNAMSLFSQIKSTLDYLREHIDDGPLDSRVNSGTLTKSAKIIIALCLAKSYQPNEALHGTTLDNYVLSQLDKHSLTPNPFNKPKLTKNSARITITWSDYVATISSQTQKTF